jgi:hypothetical protein
VCVCVCVCVYWCLSLRLCVTARARECMCVCVRRAVQRMVRGHARGGGAGTPSNESDDSEAERRSAQPRRCAPLCRSYAPIGNDAAIPSRRQQRSHNTSQARHLARRAPIGAGGRKPQSSGCLAAGGVRLPAAPVSAPVRAHARKHSRTVPHTGERAGCAFRRVRTGALHPQILSLTQAACKP